MSDGIPSFVSTVTDKLTSEVEITSTETLWRAKASTIHFRNPSSCNQRGAATSTMVMPFFTAIALNMWRDFGARAVILVPSQVGLREFNTYTGMFF